MFTLYLEYINVLYVSFCWCCTYHSIDIINPLSSQERCRVLLKRSFKILIRTKHINFHLFHQYSKLLIYPDSLHISYYTSQVLCYLAYFQTLLLKYNASIWHSPSAVLPQKDSTCMVIHSEGKASNISRLQTFQNAWWETLSKYIHIDWRVIYIYNAHAESNKNTLLDIVNWRTSH